MLLLYNSYRNEIVLTYTTEPRACSRPALMSYIQINKASSVNYYKVAVEAMLCSYTLWLGRFLKSETTSTMSHEPSRWKHVAIRRPGCMLHSTSISLQSRSRKGRNKREQEVPLFPEAYDGTALERYNNIPNAAFSATALRNSLSLSLPLSPSSCPYSSTASSRRRNVFASRRPQTSRASKAVLFSSHETESTNKPEKLFSRVPRLRVTVTFSLYPKTRRNH